MRPLTAALALLGGEFELCGVPRMHERPIGDLVDACASWAARSTTWAIRATRRCASRTAGVPALALRTSPIQVRGDVSSQFLTAAHGAALGRHPGPLYIEVVGELISKPLHRHHPAVAGAVRHSGAPRQLAAVHHPGRQPYQSPGSIYVEADASSAAIS